MHRFNIGTFYSILSFKENQESTRSNSSLIQFHFSLLIFPNICQGSIPAVTTLEIKSRILWKMANFHISHNILTSLPPLWWNICPEIWTCLLIWNRIYYELERSFVKMEWQKTRLRVDAGAGEGGGFAVLMFWYKVEGSGRYTPESRLAGDDTRREQREPVHVKLFLLFSRRKWSPESETLVTSDSNPLSSSRLEAIVLGRPGPGHRGWGGEWGEEK